MRKTIELWDGGHLSPSELYYLFYDFSCLSQICDVNTSIYYNYVTYLIDGLSRVYLVI